MPIPRSPALSLLAASFYAQTSGTITGTVTDPSKAVIPGVKVSAKLQGAEAPRETVSNSAGQYAFPFLPPGDYTIEFQFQGFATLSRISAAAANRSRAVSPLLSLGESTDSRTRVQSSRYKFHKASFVSFLSIVRTVVV